MLIDDVSVRVAIAIGLPLALSSTAQVLPMLRSDNDLHTPHGERAFSILLFQDLSIIPLITIVAALAPRPDPSAPAGLTLALYTVLAVVGLIAVGRFLLNPLFRLIGRFGERELFAIIGPNGAGKTTLFRMLVGQEAPDAGSITIGDTVQLSYVDQSRDELRADKSVFEEITDGVEVVKVGSREVPARAYVSSFNFRGTDQQKLVGQLSGGERNRVHLAKLLQTGGNVLLLDEPTNDLDVETLRALEDALENFAGCAVVISHDRFFLDRLATHILAFEGDSHVEWFEGNFEAYEEDKRRRLGPDADLPHRTTYKKLTR